MTCTPAPRYGRAAATDPLPVPPLGSCPATWLDLDIDRALDELRRTFPGLCIWHGEWSGSLWALLPSRLVEARTSTDLARQLHAALGPPVSPVPSTRRPDGTWAVPAPSARRHNGKARHSRRGLARLLAAGLRMVGRSRPATA